MHCKAEVFLPVNKDSNSNSVTYSKILNVLAYSHYMTTNLMTRYPKTSYETTTYKHEQITLEN